MKMYVCMTGYTVVGAFFFADTKKTALNAVLGSSVKAQAGA